MELERRVGAFVEGMPLAEWSEFIDTFRRSVGVAERESLVVASELCACTRDVEQTEGDLESERTTGVDCWREWYDFWRRGVRVEDDGERLIWWSDLAKLASMSSASSLEVFAESKAEASLAEKDIISWRWLSLLVGLEWSSQGAGARE